MSDGMRIHVSETTKHLLDKVGGFRCDYRGIFDLEVTLFTYSKEIFLRTYGLKFSPIKFLEFFIFNSIVGNTVSNGNVLAYWKR